MDARIWICLLTLPLAPVYSIKNYVGCFNSSFVTSNGYFQVQHSLPAQECLGVCDNRLTRYAALQSSSSYDYCFCGNDLLERSTRVDNSTCVPCSDAPWTCGTNLTVALYKLRDSTPVAVLLATVNGVEMFKENLSTTIIPTSESVIWVDFSYAADLIFVRHYNKILRSSYNYLMLKYGTLKTIFSCSTKIDELTVDWVRKKVLFVEYVSDKIEEVDYNGSSPRLVFDHDYTIKDLHVDPYVGALFFIDFTHYLHSFLLQNNTLLHYNQSKLHYYSAHKIAIDIHEQVVYLIVQLDVNSPLYIVSTEYGDTKTPTVLFSGPELTDAMALDVFHGDIYWVNYYDNSYNMYRCHLTPRCKEENLIMMYQSTSAINDMRVFHPYKQTRYYVEITTAGPEVSPSVDGPTTELTITERSATDIQTTDKPPTKFASSANNRLAPSVKDFESNIYSEATTTFNSQLSNGDQNDYSTSYHHFLVNIFGTTITIMITVFGLLFIYVKLSDRLKKLARQQVNMGGLPLEDIHTKNTYVDISDFQRKPSSPSPPPSC